jgi:hypothetical protein
MLHVLLAHTHSRVQLVVPLPLNVQALNLRACYLQQAAPLTFVFQYGCFEISTLCFFVWIRRSYIRV